MCSSGVRNACLRTPAPDMADRESECVSGVRRLGATSSRRIRVTIEVTWALSARPLPVTDAFTSLGVCITNGNPRRAAASIGTADACAVPMIPLMFALAKTRSTATTSGS